MALELSQLRYFVKVAELGNISRAAAALRIAQSAISRQIRNLELELGRELFSRSDRGVALTAAGRDYLDGIKAALKQLDETNEVARAGIGQTRILRLGVVQLVQWYPMVTDLLSRFREEHPDVRFEGLQMPSSEHVSALNRGDIDIAIGVPLVVLPAGMGRIDLFTMNRGVVMSASHPLAGKPDLSANDLQPFPLITAARNTWVGDISRFFEASVAEGLTVNFAELFDNFSLLLARLRDMHSIGIMPEPGPDAPMEGLVFRRVPALDIEFPVAVYWLANAQSLESRAFVELVAKGVAERLPASPTAS